MNYFRRGRHRANRFRPTVAEIIAEARRIPIAELFAMRDEIWSERAHLTKVWSPQDYADAAVMIRALPGEVIA